MVYKEYTISFYGKQYSRKPDSKEAGIITSKLKPATLTYEFLAQRVGEDGCSFAPAVFNGYCIRELAMLTPFQDAGIGAADHPRCFSQANQSFTSH